MKTKKNKHPNINGGLSHENIFKMSLYALGISICIALVLLLGGTAIALATPDPTALIDPIGYVSVFSTAFFGGFASSKLNKKSPYLTSILCGAGFVLISFLVSFTLSHTLASGMDIWVKLLIHTLTFLTFPLGALAGVKGAEKSNHKKKKRR